MKNILKLAGIAALAAVIGFSLAACGGGGKKGGALNLPGQVSISPESPRLGDTLEAEYNNSVPGSDSLRYQWYSGETEDSVNNKIDGATGSEYEPETEGWYKVSVSAAGYNSKDSGAVYVLDDSDFPLLPGAVTIECDSAVIYTGDELRAVYDAGGEEEPEGLEYQWFTEGEDEDDIVAIQHAAQDKFTPEEAGKYIVRVIAEGYRGIYSDAVEVLESDGDEDDGGFIEPTGILVPQQGAPGGPRAVTTEGIGLINNATAEGKITVTGTASGGGGPTMAYAVKFVSGGKEWQTASQAGTTFVISADDLKEGLGLVSLDNLTIEMVRTSGGGGPITINAEFSQGERRVRNVSISPAGPTEVEVGSSITLSAHITPEEATNKNVSWSTSDSLTASVNNGVVTGVKEGSAVITVKTEDGGLEAVLTVTVTPSTAASRLPVTYEINRGLDAATNNSNMDIAGTNYNVTTGNTYITLKIIEPGILPAAEQLVVKYARTNTTANFLTLRKAEGNWWPNDSLARLPMNPAAGGPYTLVYNVRSITADLESNQWLILEFRVLDNDDANGSKGGGDGITINEITFRLAPPEVTGSEIHPPHGISAGADTHYKVDQGGEMHFNAALSGTHTESVSGVTWTLTGSSAGSTISQDGLLKVSLTEAVGAILTVKAVSQSNEDAEDTVTVRVSAAGSTVYREASGSLTWWANAGTGQGAATINGGNAAANYTSTWIAPVSEAAKAEAALIDIDDVIALVIHHGSQANAKMSIRFDNKTPIHVLSGTATIPAGSGIVVIGNKNNGACQPTVVPVSYLKAQGLTSLAFNQLSIIGEQVNTEDTGNLALYPRLIEIVCKQQVEVTDYLLYADFRYGDTVGTKDGITTSQSGLTGAPAPTPGVGYYRTGQTNLYLNIAGLTDGKYETEFKARNTGNNKMQNTYLHYSDVTANLANADDTGMLFHTGYTTGQGNLPSLVHNAEYTLDFTTTPHTGLRITFADANGGESIVNIEYVLIKKLD
jgi:hypothetical protein